MKKVLAISSNSSSFKYKLFGLPDENVLAEGLGDRIGIQGSTFEMKLENGQKYSEEVALPDQGTAVKILLDWLKKYDVARNLTENVDVGHRIVSGGEKFTDSAIIGEKNLQEIFDLTDYAPLHNPTEGRGIKAFMNLLPGVPQVAVFDTSFHQTVDKVHYLYSILFEYHEKYKARKYGVHGTSVRYVTNRTAELLHRDLSDLKMIICHLESGASIIVVKSGKSFDASMGFSPPTGVTTGTRSGNANTSLIQFIMDKEGINDIDDMIDILNRKSGLLGISRISSGMRDLENSRDRKAKLARDVFINRVIRYAGSYAVEMGGINTLIFIAGIGKHDAYIREGIMKPFECMRLDLDFEASKTNGGKLISKDGSKIAALIVPTDEELIIERDVVHLVHLD